MSSLRRARRNVIIVLSVLLAIDVACAAVFFSPLGKSGAAVAADFDSLRRQVKGKMRVVIPPDQVQQRVNDAGKQIDVFYKTRFPAEASNISERLGALAAQNKVKLSQARYAMDDAEIPGLKQVTIEATLDGDYVNQVKFINALERDKLFFIVDSVNLGEAESGGVRLQVAVETYLNQGQAQ